MAHVAFYQGMLQLWRSADAIKSILEEQGRSQRSLAIDLGSQQTVSGFAFTPQKQGGKGTVAGIIRISNDGKNWKEVERFEFGNLINDPSKRYHHFKQTVKARYVQVEAAEIAARTELPPLLE